MKKEKSYMYTFIIFIKIFKRKIYYSTKHVGFPHKIEVSGFEFDLRWKYHSVLVEKSKYQILRENACQYYQNCLLWLHGRSKPGHIWTQLMHHKKAHLQNKWFALKFKFEEMLLNYLYLYKKKNQVVFFSFFISSNFHFYLMNTFWMSTFLFLPIMIID